MQAANMLMNEHDDCKVADFGVARVMDTTCIMTAETGTYRWMAPEVRRCHFVLRTPCVHCMCRPEPVRPEPARGRARVVGTLAEWSMAQTAARWLRFYATPAC